MSYLLRTCRHACCWRQKTGFSLKSSRITTVQDSPHRNPSRSVPRRFRPWSFPLPHPFLSVIRTGLSRFYVYIPDHRVHLPVGFKTYPHYRGFSLGGNQPTNQTDDGDKMIYLHCGISYNMEHTSSLEASETIHKQHHYTCHTCTLKT